MAKLHTEYVSASANKCLGCVALMALTVCCRPETWRDICPSEAEEDRQDALDQLSSYLVSWCTMRLLQQCK